MLRLVFLLTVLLPLSAASPAAGAATGIPGLTADAVVTADGVTVHFAESGLDPLESVSIAVAASRETTAECVTPGPEPAVLFHTTSAGNANDVTEYVADAAGGISANRVLAVTAQPPNVAGLPCNMRTSYLVTVVVTDLSRGISVRLERRG